MTEFTAILRENTLQVLLATGCRINETLALEWSDIDLDSAVVHITKTLNYKQEINSPKSKSEFTAISISTPRRSQC